MNPMGMPLMQPPMNAYPPYLVMSVQQQQSQHVIEMPDNRQIEDKSLDEIQNEQQQQKFKKYTFVCAILGIIFPPLFLVAWIYSRKSTDKTVINLGKISMAMFDIFLFFLIIIFFFYY